MEELKKAYPEFYTLHGLARLGLWEHASFYSADSYDNFRIYKQDDDLYFDCQIQNRSISGSIQHYNMELHRSLRWVSE